MTEQALRTSIYLSEVRSVSDVDRLIEHYKSHIARAVEAEDNKKIIKCLSMLYPLPITTQNLQNTGIGLVVNSLRYRGENVGKLARTVVLLWKNVVKTELTVEYYNSVEE